MSWAVLDATPNVRRAGFEIRALDEYARPPEVHHLFFPFTEVSPTPSRKNPVSRIWIDRDRDGFAFVLESEDSGMVWLYDVFSYEEDRGFLRSGLLEKLTDEARRRLAASGRSRKELARRLKTSDTQVCRLLSDDHSRKTLDGLVKLIHVLDGVVEVSVRDWTPFEPD